MFCPTCGKQNPDGAHFCGQCGRDLRGYAKQPLQTATSVPAGAATPNLGKRSFLILAVAALVVIGVVIFGITRCVGGGGRGSAEDLANELTAPYQRIFDDSLSSASVEAFAETVLGAMPPEAVDAMLEESGTDSREEAIEQLGDSLVVGPASGVESVLDKVDVEIRITVGDTLDDDQIDSLNEDFEDHDISLEVTDACTLGADMPMTAREDVGTLDAGESTSQEASNSGLIAIEIDGSWYLWTSSINW